MNIKKILLLGGVGLASAAVGILLPDMMVGGHSPAPAVSPAQAAAGHDPHGGHEAAPAHDKPEAKHEPAAKPAAHGSDHGGGEHGKEEAKPKEGPQFLSFGQIVVNLNEPNLLRYLSLDISIQTDAKNEKEVRDALESRKAILKTWLTSHLADKTIEDIRGKVGVNRLRREIQDNFNSLLFKDGHERIQDILFEEHHVQ